MGVGNTGLVTLLEAKPAGVAEWLDAFDVADRGTAEMLLSCIEFVSRSRFSAWTEDAIERVVNSATSSVALFAVRELDPTVRLFPDNPDERPDAAPGSDVGSEGLVSHLLKSICRKNTKALQHPSISEMRRSKVSDIVLIDDIVGSGRTALNYLAALYSHPTIRSWMSRHLVAFHVIAYSALTEGAESVASACSRARSQYKTLVEVQGKFFHVARHQRRLYPPTAPIIVAASDGSCLQTADPARTLSRIRSLCKYYGHKWGIPDRWRLGYRDTLAFVVFEHGCPNNAPGLLWFRSKHGPNPLIPGRLPKLAPREERWEKSWTGYTPDLESEETQQGFVLDCVLRGVRHVSAISRRTGLPSNRIKELLRLLRTRGLVDAHRRAQRPAIAVRIRQPAGCVVDGACPYLPRWLRETSEVR